MKESGQGKLECKHFFSGAASFVNGKIFASLTPVGFALKLPKENIEKLLSEGGKPLKYFSKAPTKKGYVVLSKQTMADTINLRRLVKISMNYTLGSK